MGGDQQVAGRLGRRVGRGGVERRGLGEGAGLDRAVDLVGRDLQVAADAELAGGVEQGAGADHVGAGEGVLVVDRAVDVGLGGEVDDRVDALHRLADDLRVLDRALDQLDALGQVLRPAGVGELVEHDDLVLGAGDADVGGADESGGAGDEQLHAASLSASSLGEIAGQPVLPGGQPDRVLALAGQGREGRPRRRPAEHLGGGREHFALDLGLLEDLARELVPGALPAAAMWWMPNSIPSIRRTIP